jgi:hypothetical protein
MKITKFFLLLIIISFTLGFISCNKKDNSSKSNQVKNDTSAVLSPEEALKEIGEQIQKAVLEGDYETQLKFYAEDAVCVPSFQI